MHLKKPVPMPHRKSSPLYLPQVAWNPDFLRLRRASSRYSRRTTTLVAISTTPKFRCRRPVTRRHLRTVIRKIAIFANIYASFPVLVRTIHPVEMCPFWHFLSLYTAKASVLTKPVRQALIRRGAIFNVASWWIDPSRLAACIVERVVNR